MKTAWVMQGGSRLLAVDLIPKGTVLGVGHLVGQPGLVPAIMLSYTLDQLELFRPALQDMEKLDIAPKVYIWNITKKRPDFRLDFEIPVAGRELVRRFAHKDMFDVLESADSMAFAAGLRVMSSGWGGPRTENFRRLFKRLGHAHVVVNEFEGHIPSGQEQEVSTPIARFVVTAIGNDPPAPFGIE